VLGTTLPAIGRLDEAIEEMRKAITLDPLSAQFSRWLGRFLLYSRDYVHGRAGAVFLQKKCGAYTIFSASCRIKDAGPETGRQRAKITLGATVRARIL
jgi:two-component SAPR family response regulator